MLVKNTSAKIIGFGKVTILPGETGKLPAGFGPGHPTVKFFIKHGYISSAIVDGLGSPVAPAAIPTKAKGDDGVDVTLLTARDIGRMNRDPLRDLAAQLQIEWSANDTRAALITKISDVLFPEEEACIEEPDVNEDSETPGEE